MALIKSLSLKVSFEYDGVSYFITFPQTCQGKRFGTKDYLSRFQEEHALEISDVVLRLVYNDAIRELQRF